VFWARSLVVAAYGALAVVVGIAYGGSGLLTLGYYYFCAGAWVVFLLAWNWGSREAGRRYFRWLDRPRRPPSDA
jgi:hypothetical protein